jgi:uncharacterized protein (TIGR02118 family)
MALAPWEPSPYHLIARLYFEQMSALQMALQSPEGQATADDLPQFATGGAALVVGEVEGYQPMSAR